MVVSLCSRFLAHPVVDYGTGSSEMLMIEWIANDEEDNWVRVIADQ